MNMRPSRVLKKLRAGQVAVSMKLNLADPRVAEMAAMWGFDCLWLDLEHVPNTVQDVGNQVRAAKIYDVDTVVRVPRGSYSDLLYPFEMDATGIMVPHLMSVADARQLVRQTRFYPLGQRPMDGGNADGQYTAISVADYIEQANRERFVIAQIEDPEPLAELDAIAQVPGIDMLFFGPGDFSQAIGAPGNFADPRITDARQRVAQACKKHGKFAGTVGSPDNISSLVEMGYHFVNLGSDVRGLMNHFQNMAKAIRKD